MAILAFVGPRRWLSNFWPCRIMLDGLEFASAEHAYQAKKCALSQDAERVRLCGTPAEAKRLARRCKMKADWDRVKIAQMCTILVQKFAAGSDLAERLLATGEQDLVEGNYWGDTFWGTVAGVGHNWLGRLLMERRAQLRQLPAERAM